MANKISRTQEVKDPENGVVAKHSITGVHFSVSVNYSEELTIGNKTYGGRQDSESISDSFAVSSIEDFENMIKTQPALAEFMSQIFDKIKEKYK